MYKKYLVNLNILNKWAKAYYDKTSLLASDDEYDNLYNKVKEFENNNKDKISPFSLTQRVGFKISKGFGKQDHLDRLYSQQDFFTIKELVKWSTNIKSKYPDVTFIAEPKYDGLSLSLVYKNGKLDSAVTRGDGITGYDVTNNARHILNIPLTVPIKDTIEIHGEVVMSKEVFDKVNEKRLLENELLFANPRNAAAGTIRTLNSKIMLERELSFIAWEFGIGYKKSIKTLSSLSNIMSKKLLFTTTKYKAFDNVNIIDVIHNEFVRTRNINKFGLDGVVFKVNEKHIRDTLGYTSKYPKWSCAMKFQAVEVTTTIVDVINQVGRTGVVTPVALLKPVLIDGSMVNKATLHNYSQIKKRDIRINDEVIVIKSGDIIPKVIHVFTDRRDSSSKQIKIPRTCPVCDTILKTTPTYILCVNDNCSSRLHKLLELFVGRDYMNIQGVGPSNIKLLIENKLINNSLDLYKLTYKDLTKIKLKKKSIDNLLSSINESKNTTLDKFIASLGIPTFGRTLSTILVSKYGFSLLDFTYTDFINEPNVGDVIAKNFINYMRDNKELVNGLLEVLNLTLPKTYNGSLNNEVIVLTGSFTNGKYEVENLIKKHGGTVKKQFTKNTTMLVYGDKAGTKLEKAKELNIKTMTLLELQTNI